MWNLVASEIEKTNDLLKIKTIEKFDRSFRLIEQQNSEQIDRLVYFKFNYLHKLSDQDVALFVSQILHDVSHVPGAERKQASSDILERIMNYLREFRCNCAFALLTSYFSQFHNDQIQQKITEINSSMLGLGVGIINTLTGGYLF